MKTIVTILGMLILVLSSVATGCGSSTAEVVVSPEDFYKGKTIDWTSPDKPGDTVDLFSRVMAPYLQQSTGATVVVSNLREAGGNEAFAHVYTAEPDGLHLGGAATGSLWLNDIMGAPGSEAFDSAKFTYLGGINREPLVFVVSPKGPYTSVAALQSGKGIKLGGTSASGRYAIGTLSVAYLLDLDAKVITGATGAAAIKLAIQQQEVAGGCIGTSTVLKEVQAGTLKPLFVLSTQRDKDLYPDIPAITELVSLTGEKMMLTEAWANQDSIRVLLGTPGMPADRVTFLRKIISDKIFTDPAFQKQIDTLIGYTNKAYLTGEEMENMAKDLFGNKEKIKDMFQVADKKYRG